MSTQNNLITSLKMLQHIAPSDDFARNEKHILLTLCTTSTCTNVIPTHRTRITWMSFIGVATACALLVVIITTTLRTTSVIPSVAASLDSATLTKEFDTLNIAIELKEITYTKIRENTISSAMKEIKNTTTNHLNESLLESEQGFLEVKSVTNQSIDTLLEQINK